MKDVGLTVLVSVVVLGLLASGVTWAEPMGTAFTYQGRLTDYDGNPFQGSYDFEFMLYDDPDGGSQIGDTFPVDNQEVTKGLFTVVLDPNGQFGPDAFTGEARWLEVHVREAGVGEFSQLLPRQKVTPTPYAIHAETAASVVDGITGSGTAGRIVKFTGTDTVDDSIIYESVGGDVGIGTTDPNAKLEVAGMVHSTSGGFKFPDGSVQDTALTGGQWERIGDDVFYTGGNVGIGTEGPFYPAGDILVPKSAVLPTRRDGLACAADPNSGKIYCFGGHDGSSYLDEILEYDPVTDILITKAAVLPTGRYYLACAASPATGKIYCFGGHDGDDRLDEILEYDPVADTCVPVSAVLPTGRYGLACAADPATGKIYCFGGNASGGLLNEILEYDPVADTCVPVSAVLPTGRFYLACAASPATGKIYCFGGHDGGYVDEILEYDPVADTCVPASAVLPTARYTLGCAADPATGKIYCFGGYDGSFLDEILEYTPPCQARLQVGEPGDGTGAIANTWSQFSSRKFKRDIMPLGAADYQDILAKLMATDVVRYRYIRDTQRRVHLGVIAEDAPTEILGAGGQSISLGDYSAFLMAAIKTQQTVIEKQDQQIAETQARLTKLEALVGKPADTQNGGAQ